MTASRSRPLALLFALIPGWGHIYLGRELFGLLVFTLAAVFGFLLLNALFLFEGEAKRVLILLSAILLGVVWVGSWIHCLVRTSAERRAREELARTRLLRQGTVDYLRGDFVAAVINFRACLAIDPQDVEALFRLGVSLARQVERGELALRKQALRWLRKAERNDFERKWEWELGRELEALEGRSGAGAAGETESGRASADDPRRTGATEVAPSN